MTALGRILLAMFCFYACSSVVEASEPLADAKLAFGQGYWATAIELLEPYSGNSEATQMLAIAYFRVRDFDNALPFLEKALAAEPDNLDMIEGMMEVRLALRQYPEARVWINRLDALDKVDLANFGRARMLLCKSDVVGCQSDPVKAKSQLRTLVDEAEKELALRAADTLIDAYLADDELGPAYEVAQQVLSNYPDPILAFRYAPFIPENQVTSSFEYDLGYRFEYDDNITFPDDVLASGEGDYRHVIMADVLYERPLGDDWSFYASGNFLQSFHHDLDEFDRTRIAGSVAVGHMGRRTGWRVPVELTHVRLDGDTFRNSIAVIPGFYVQFGNDFLSHFYARLQQDDYDWFTGTKEDRSGNVAGAGVLLTGQVTRRLQVRSYFEFNRYDSDGTYWARDEEVAFVYGEFEITPRWQAALAFRYKRENYDNAREVFADRQKDESKEIFLNITNEFAEKWWWRGQVSLIKHDSNIAIFEYDRNIYSIAVTRDF